MGKKKKEKRDFQKIKLKVGRSLKKDTNVTDTTFKTKKINIKSQLKIALNQGLSDELVTRKSGTDGLNLSLKELLSRLAHYNPSNRLSSVIRLKDLLTSNPQHITAHLPSILENVCALMVDKDSMIRKAVQYVLNFVLEKVTEKQISPFFPVIGSYVCCAMTHITSGIREDSLKFLDILLEKFSDLTVSSAGQILTNFLDQISVEKGKGVRTLTVTPNERITSQKWRLSVLKRMEKFLQASFRNWTCSNSQNKEKAFKEIVWDCMTLLYVPIYGSLNGLPQPSVGFSLSSVQNPEKGDHLIRLGDPESLQKLISVLLPLLVETWVECVSSRNRNDTQLATEELETMLCVLEVTVLLGDWIEVMEKDSPELRNWLGDCFAKDFIIHFMPGFPYSVTTYTNDRKSPGLELNLALCQVCTLLEIEQEYDRVVKFLSKALKKGSQLPGISKVIQVVRRMIKNRPTIHYGQSTLDEYIESLIECLWSLVQQWSYSRKDRQAIVAFFFDLVLDHNSRHLLRSNTINSWLGIVAKDVVSLADEPELLLTFLKGVRKISPCKYPTFLNGLQEEAHHIIGLLAKFECTEDGTVASYIQRYLVELIFSIPELDLQSFQALGKISRSNKVLVRNLNYLLQILSLRCFDNKDPGFKASHFLSLLLSLQFGVSHNDSEALKFQYASIPELSHFRSSTPPVSQFTVFPSDSQTWERHLQLTEEVSQIILRFPDRSSVEKASYQYLKNLMAKVHTLPSHSVAGILNYVTTLQMANEPNEAMIAEDVCISLVELSLAGLSAAILLTDLSEKLAPMFRCDEFLDMVLSFLQMTECLELLCGHLPKKFDLVKTLNEREAKCIGKILLHIMKAEVVQKYHLEKFKGILQKIQSMPGLKVMDQSWWIEVVYQLKLQLGEVKLGRRQIFNHFV